MATLPLQPCVTRWLRGACEVQARIAPGGALMQHNRSHERLPGMFRNTVADCTARTTRAPIHPVILLPCSRAATHQVAILQHSTVSRWLAIAAATRGPASDGRGPAKRLCDRQPSILHDRKVTGRSLAACNHVSTAAQIASCCTLGLCAALAYEHPMFCSSSVGQCRATRSVHARRADASPLCIITSVSVRQTSPAIISVLTPLDTDYSGSALSV